MSFDWQITTLGEVSTWMSGGTPKKDVMAYWNGDIPWISANSMYGTRYSDSTLRISQEGLEKGSRLTPKNSILLLVRGGALHNRIPVGIATRDVAFNQDVKALIVKKTILSPWYLLFWVMGHERFLLDSVVEYTGIGAGKLDTKRMQGLEFLLPPLAEQTAIVSVLKAIDDRIALLRETNTTLEAIAQALFKSWFVDFDPVHAKQQGRELEGMDADTAALFPDSFEESELGLVPKGWKVGSIGDNTIYLSRGISPKYLEEGGILVINQKCIRNFILDLSKARRHDPVKRRINGRELFIGDILVNSTGVGTLGRVAQVLCTDELMIVDSHVTVVRASENLTWNYLGLSMIRRQAEIENLGEGSTGQTELNRSKLATLKLIIPSKEMLRQRFAANIKQASTLATLRDTLLPRLISGQLRLPEPEAMLEKEK